MVGAVSLELREDDGPGCYTAFWNGKSIAHVCQQKSGCYYIGHSWGDGLWMEPNLEAAKKWLVERGQSLFDKINNPI